MKNINIFGILVICFASCSSPTAYTAEIDTEELIGIRLFMVNGDECLFRETYKYGSIGGSTWPRSQWNFLQRKSPQFKIEDYFKDYNAKLTELVGSEWNENKKGYKMERSNGGSDTLWYIPSEDAYYLVEKYRNGYSDTIKYQRDKEYDGASFEAED